VKALLNHKENSMSAVSRIVAVSLFVVGIMLGNSASAAPQDVIDEMRALVTDAYVAGGWSERDAEVIAAVKVDRMIAQEADGDIEDFVPMDHWDSLCQGSDGIAVVIDHFVQDYSWDYDDASDAVWSMYSSLNGWNLADPSQSMSTPDTCPAYTVTYQFCRNGIITTRSAWWDAQCYYDNFINNPCVGTPFGCDCEVQHHCAVTYIPVGNCGGATPGECIRIIRVTFAGEINCTSIVTKGGCADCSAPPPTDPECPTPILAACVHVANGPCGGCQQQPPTGD